MSQVRWGCAISAGVTATDLDSFEALAGGKKISLLGVGTWWWGGGTYPTGAYNGFPTSKANLINSRGGIFLLDWSPGLSSGNDPAFNNRSIYLNHTHDAYIDSFATTIKSLPYTVLIRPFHEMNGSWYPTWWEGSSYNLGMGSGDLIAAFRYVVTRFRNIGCNNVKWVWNPNVMSTVATSSTHQPLSQLYPGDDVVDFKAIDGYNDGNPWRSFQQVMDGIGTTGLQNTLQNVKSVGSNPNMPIIVAETGCHDSDGVAKAQWFKDASAYFSGHPELVGIVYSQYNEGGSNWRIDYPLTGAGAGTTAPAFGSPEGFGSAHFLAGGLEQLQPADSQPYVLNPIVTDHYGNALKSTTGRVVYLPMQEASGATTLVDASGSALNGSVVGSPVRGDPVSVIPSSPSRLSVHFPGDNASAITLPNDARTDPANSTAYTWCIPFILQVTPTANAFLWAKGTDVPSASWSFDNYVAPTLNPNFTLRNTGNTSSTDLHPIPDIPLPLNTPLLWQARINGNAMQLQISSKNGGFRGDIVNMSGTYPFTLSPSTALAMIGKRARNSDASINGNISDAFAANVFVTDQSLQEHYEAWVASPDVASPTVSVSGTSATFNWTSVALGTSQVEIGPTTSYGTVSALDSRLLTAHSVVMAGLAPGTYHYRITSMNSAGTRTVTADLGTFTIAGAGIDRWIKVQQPGRTFHARLGDASKVTGAAAVDVINAINGTYQGNCVDVAGLIRGALDHAVQFDGASYVAFPSNALLLPHLTGPASWSCWYQEGAAPAVTQALYAIGTAANWSYGLQRTSTGIVFTIWQLSGNPAMVASRLITPAPAVPHHIVATWDTVALSLFLDGVLMNSSNVAPAGAFGNSTAGLNIGRRPAADQFLGTAASPCIMDEVVIRNRALKPGEVLREYYSGLNRFTSAAVA